MGGTQKKREAQPKQVWDLSQGFGKILDLMMKSLMNCSLIHWLLTIMIIVDQ